jgi:hypothetical protein
MMSFHKAVPLDQGRAKHAQDEERLSIGASLMIWMIVAGFAWFGIFAMLGSLAS